MKFKDIPQYTRVGSNEYSCDLKYFVEHIKSEVEEGLVLNPDFQRGHVWSEDQQCKFIEFYLKGGLMQPIYLNAQNLDYITHDGKYVCVDGLQRITALTRFYNNEIKAFGMYYKDFEGKAPMSIKVNTNNLKTRKEVLQWYIELNSGGTIHTTAEIERVKKLLWAED